MIKLKNMETKKNQPSSQEAGSQSKPLLVKIIAIITIILGSVTLLSWLYFSIMMPMGISNTVLSIVLSLAIIVAGLGLLLMKRWGLYLFLILALYLIIGAMRNVISAWPPWRWFGTWALIPPTLLIIGAIFSLVYLWRIRARFK